MSQKEYAYLCKLSFLIGRYEKEINLQGGYRDSDESSASETVPLVPDFSSHSSLDE